MRGHRRALAFLVLVLPAAAVLAAPAGKWVRLFDGKDLAGWKAHGAERWVVDKGEILGETLTKEYGYLSTERTYRDFELKVKFKAEGTGNSGVFFHSSLDGVAIAGVQAEVDPRPGMHTGGLYESAGREMPWLSAMLLNFLSMCSISVRY